MWGAVEHAAGPASSGMVAVVEPAEHGAVVDARGAAEGVVDDVVRLAPIWLDVASWERTSAVSGDHGQTLAFGKDPVRGAVGLDPFRLVENPSSSSNRSSRMSHGSLPIVRVTRPA